MIKTDRLPNQQSLRPEPKQELSIFQRIHKGDPSAVEDCTAMYGEYVNQLAKFNMPSDEEAENAAERIFDDICTFARSGQGSHTRDAEIEAIRQIAVRRILKQSWDGRRVF